MKIGSKVTVLSHSKGGKPFPGEIVSKHEKPDHYVVKTKNWIGGETKLVVHKSMIKEEAPVNAAGNAAVAGLGVGPQGEPPVKRKKFKDFIRRGQPK